MRTSLLLGIGAALILVLAGCDTPGPAGPSPATTDGAPVQTPGPALTDTASTPPFNLEAILRPVAGIGFGLVKFRQPNDTNLTVFLDVWVRDLAPNTEYQLQRAVDAVIDGECTSTAWLTLGKGLQPQSITTDASGTGRESLFRVLPSSALGTASDIHFRIVEASTQTPVLQSACYRFVTSL
jgi:hypothetical protein